MYSSNYYFSIKIELIDTEKCPPNEIWNRIFSQKRNNFKIPPPTWCVRGWWSGGPGCDHLWYWDQTRFCRTQHPAGLLDPTHSPPNPRIERSKSLGLKLDKNFVFFQNLDSKKLPRFFLGLQMMWSLCRRCGLENNTNISVSTVLNAGWELLSIAGFHCFVLITF